jgi:tetratricopeptide (TPR) repeat protein
MEEARGPSWQEVHGNQNAISLYGDASVHLHPPPLSSELPERVWMVPYRRNSFFTGRETLLTALHERFLTDRRAVLTQGQAISGLGGIGKTEVAVEYAYRHREEYRFVLWASASPPETLLAAYVSMADRLHLPERNMREQDKIVAAVLQWLATHEDWLLIIDNADELESVWPWLPTGSTGHVVLTTRDQLVADMQSFLVEEMDGGEGTLLLLGRAHILKTGMELGQVSLEDRQVAEQIVVEMDGLPLALDQAGAYIEETGCSLTDYRNRFRQRRKDLLSRRGRSGRGYPASVGSTWSLSFQQVEQRSAAAADLLRVCAYLSPDAIPEEMIVAGATQLGPLLQPLATDPTLLDEAIAILRGFSLVRRNSQEQTFSIHRLVQAVLKESMNEQTLRQWAERTVRAVNLAFPDVTNIKLWEQCERYLPHALVCVTFIEEYSFAFAEAARLLNQTAYYLDSRAQYPQAEPLYQRALAIDEKASGPEHPDTATSLNNLAELYHAQGKYEQAEPLLQRALAIREKQSGPEHPDTAVSLNNLAGLYLALDKYEQAEPLFRRALAIREKQLGPEHPDTAQSLNNLAALYDAQGKYEQAEPLYQRALAIREKQLGPEHPDTAQSLNNLAGLYRMQGKYEQAEPLFRRALAIREKQLGPEHPDTALSLNNLAGLYRTQGKYEQAEPLYQRALAIREKMLGPEHPDTASSLNNLAGLYRMQGKYEQAEPLFRRALAIREKMLGPEHPDTALSLNNLAGLYRTQGKYEQAEPLLQRALAIREKMLGPEHPRTQRARENYVSLLQAMGRDAEAVSLKANRTSPSSHAQ